jgi:hypothetical protein
VDASSLPAVANVYASVPSSKTDANGPVAATLAPGSGELRITALPLHCRLAGPTVQQTYHTVVSELTLPQCLGWQPLCAWVGVMVSQHSVGLAPSTSFSLLLFSRHNVLDVATCTQVVLSPVASLNVGIACLLVLHYLTSLNRTESILRMVCTDLCRDCSIAKFCLPSMSSNNVRLMPRLHLLRSSRYLSNIGTSIVDCC